MKTKNLLRALVVATICSTSLDSYSQCNRCGDQVPINNNLVLCLPFNNNTNDESSGGSYSGTASGGSFTTDRYGNTASAYNFDGVNDYIDLAGTLPDQTDATLSMWINATGNSSTLGFIFFDGTNTCGNDFFVYYSNNLLHFGADKGSLQLTGGSGAGQVSYALSGWHHILWTMTSTQTDVYIDGSLANTFYKTASQVGYHGTASIGCLNDGGGGACGQSRNHFFAGDLDDIRLYDRILSPQEIINLGDMNCCGSCIPDVAPLMAGLQLCLPFNGNTLDETSNGYDLGAGTASFMPDRFGNSNRAASLDGSTLSLSMWIYPTGNASTLGFIIFDGTNACGNDFFVYYSNNLLHFGADKGSLQLTGGSGAGQVAFTPSGSWQHIVWTMTSTQSKIYVDGSLLTTINKTADQTGYHGTASIGSLNDGNGGACGQPRNHYFQGGVDDIRMWNRVISAGEVTELYNCDANYNLAKKGATGLLKQAEKPAFSVYPNPAKGSVSIRLETQISRSIVVNFYDVSGKKVRTYDQKTITILENEMHIDNLGLPKGIYYISIIDQGRTYKSNISIELIIELHHKNERCDNSILLQRFFMQ